MTGTSKTGAAALPWRAIGWGGAAALLAVPLAAMPFTREVDWGPGDFLVAAALIGATGLALEAALRIGRSRAYRLGAAVALGTALLTVWAQLAVGLIGEPGDPANLIFVGVVATGGGGVAIARLEPGGLARAMAATALAQLAAGAAALAAGWPLPAFVTPLLASLWLASAWLFRIAGRES